MQSGGVSRYLHSPAYVKLRQLLSHARVSAGLTQGEVAAKIARPQSFVSKYERGERQLDVVEFVAICAAIGVSPSAIVDRIAT